MQLFSSVQLIFIYWKYIKDQFYSSLRLFNEKRNCIHKFYAKLNSTIPIQAMYINLCIKKDHSSKKWIEHSSNRSTYKKKTYLSKSLNTNTNVELIRTNNHRTTNTQKPADLRGWHARLPRTKAHPSYLNRC